MKLVLSIISLLIVSCGLQNREHNALKRDLKLTKWDEVQKELHAIGEEELESHFLANMLEPGKMILGETKNIMKGANIATTWQSIQFSAKGEEVNSRQALLAKKNENLEAALPLLIFLHPDESGVDLKKTTESAHKYHGGYLLAPTYPGESICSVYDYKERKCTGEILHTSDISSPKLKYAYDTEANDLILLLQLMQMNDSLNIAKTTPPKGSKEGTKGKLKVILVGASRGGFVGLNLLAKLGALGDNAPAEVKHFLSFQGPTSLTHGSLAIPKKAILSYKSIAQGLVNQTLPEKIQASVYKLPGMSSLKPMFEGNLSSKELAFEFAKRDVTKLASLIHKNDVKITFHGHKKDALVPYEQLELAIHADHLGSKATLKELTTAVDKDDYNHLNDYIIKRFSDISDNFVGAAIEDLFK